MVRNGYKHGAMGMGLMTLLMPMTLSLSAQSQRHTTLLSTGTVVAIKLNDSLSSKDAHKGDTFTATVTTANSNDNYTVLPVGTRVEGVVREARAQEGKNPGMIDLSFDRVTLPSGRSYAISGSPIGLDSKSVTRRNGRLIAKPGNKGPNRLTYVGIGAGAGLLVNVLTHRKGTLLDTLIGGGLGYGAGSLIKSGKSARDVTLASGSKMGVRLDRSVAIAR